MNAGQNDRSKNYQLLYTAYTLIKLIVIIVLILSIKKCSNILGIYLILYCATEGYELLFMFILIGQRYCYSLIGSSFLISIGQASYEW